ncbi:hypothetical protein B5M44_03910 [Shinella sumterensis]|nr:hypothetical protein B5M44_03910 [Shinella sumterensis]
MAKLFKRGKVYYFGVSRPDGYHRESTGLASKKEAQALAEERAAQIRLADQRGFDEEKTIADAAYAYLAAGKDGRFIEPIIKKWGKRKLRGLKPEWVRQHAKDLYPAASPATLNRQVLTPVQAIVNFAYQDEDGRQIKIKRFAVDPKKKEAVDAEWHAKFAAKSKSPGMTAMARFMWETAARISEACRVTANDVDLEARTVMLTKTKTKPRLTRISPVLAEMLRPLMAVDPKRNRQNKKKVNGLFGYASRHAVYNGWKSVCDDAGIAYAPPHSAGRVTFATELVVRRGIDPVTAARLGGWASPKVMMDTYAKADPAHDVVDAIFGENVEKSAQILHTEATEIEEADFLNEISDLQAKSASNRP